MKCNYRVYLDSELLIAIYTHSVKRIFLKDILSAITSSIEVFPRDIAELQKSLLFEAFLMTDPAQGNLFRTTHCRMVPSIAESYLII